MPKKPLKIKRMDHVGVVVDDLEGALAFFVELGMERVGGVMPVEGRWVDQVVGLENVRVDIAFVRTPDGHSQLELTRFRHPMATTVEPNAPANRLGLRRLMFLVEDIQDVIDRLRSHGGELIGEVTEYQNVYRLCYLRGPGGIIVALAEEIERASEKAAAMSEHVDDIVEIAPDVHKVIFENDAIRVLEVTVTPGATVAMHTNPENINYILEGGTLRLVDPDGSVVDVPLAERQVIPAPSGRHAVENVGRTVVRTLCIELKDRAMQ
jgi:catechol 2,3-dioxygenase-like lactoylglutathione lyase family enzyme/quercetin dioxygenase-like cupin family protein